MPREPLVETLHGIGSFVGLNTRQVSTTCLLVKPRPRPKAGKKEPGCGLTRANCRCWHLQVNTHFQKKPHYEQRPEGRNQARCQGNDAP